MKRVFISIACCVALALPFAGNGAEPLFEYPQVPDQLTKVNMRSNFMINRLWDECKLDKEEITNIESFRETFTDFLSFFPLADVDEVDKAVKKFVDKVAKNEANLRTVAGFLDSEVYNPMSQFCSDDVYLIFARHLIDNKKVDDGLKNVLQENAAITRSVLSGAKGAKRDAVLLNAGAGLYTVRKVKTIEDGMEMAAQAIDSGDALRALDRYVSLTGAVS